MSPARDAQRALGLGALATSLALLLTSSALAHPISEGNAQFVQGVSGAAPAAFAYLGAKHMFTGTDHLLFLLGVIFFLYRPRDVVLYVSLFTVGHSTTLLLGVLIGVRVDPYLVDAIIGLSVVYKAFENMGGFRQWFGVQPDSRAAVAIFGLFHGLGLATKLQELALQRDGLLTNLISFNVGVEIGQVAALAAVLIALLAWRRSSGFQRHAFAANTALMAAGFVLTGQQLAGYWLQS